jgi:hypothetical protein
LTIAGYDDGVVLLDEDCSENLLHPRIVFNDQDGTEIRRGHCIEFDSFFH